MRTQKGFTLIELLVVIAIIGILAGIVLTSLDTARKKGRDARRIADVNQLKLALELYYDTNGGYPAALTNSPSDGLVTGGYISRIPLDPSSTASTQIMYTYSGLQGTTAAICGSFHLGTVLETPGHSALLSDVDASPGSICTGSNADFHGNATSCSGTTAATADNCYDVKP